MTHVTLTLTSFWDLTGLAKEWRRVKGVEGFRFCHWRVVDITTLVTKKNLDPQSWNTESLYQTVWDLKLKTEKDRQTEVINLLNTKDNHYKFFITNGIYPFHTYDHNYVKRGILLLSDLTYHKTFLRSNIKKRKKLHVSTVNDISEI